MIRILLPVATLLICLSVGAVAQTPTPTPLRLCSGGFRDGRPCGPAEPCSGGGACVVAASVCDGGSDDGFRCPCPGSVCSQAVACASNPGRGTCAGGPRAGQCCVVELGCRDSAPCVVTQKVCSSGRFKGAACLGNDDCGGTECRATATACNTGIYAEQACVDNNDCPGAVCGTACTGDCDRSGEVTVDEVLVMVNIGLGNAGLDACRAGDSNVDGQVTVDEILAAVTHALAGCPVSSTATRSPTNPSVP